MPKRVLDFDAMWGSDKLAACAAWAQAEYAWLYGLADASGCFELTNLRVIWGRVAAIRGNLTIERLEQVFAEFQDKGLLFVWEHEGKRARRDAASLSVAVWGLGQKGHRLKSVLLFPGPAA